MQRPGIRGVVRGKGGKTTVPDLATEHAADLIKGAFTATARNRFWLANVTCAATWRGSVYVAFVIDGFSRMIVGWRVWSSLKTDLAPDAPEGAVYARDVTGDLVHQSDRISRYLLIRYSGRLAKAGIESVVGSNGDSYDNAMAASIIGLLQSEDIWPRGPWKDLDEVEYATLECVNWDNNKRLLAPIGDVPPAEYEATYYEQESGPVMAAWLTQ